MADSDFVFCSASDPIDDIGVGGQVRAAAATRTIWDKSPGKTLVLNVAFFDGDPTVQELVRKTVKESWEKHADVRFQFLERNQFANAQIRITMPPSRQFQSFLGADSANMVRQFPSMTLGFTQDILNNVREARRLIMHEFGHALGLIHEHQNPQNGLRFREPQVFQFFQRTQGWDRQTVIDQVIRPVQASQLSNSSDFDPESIMLYSFPSEIIESGPVTATQVNFDLSRKDIQVIGQTYPKQPGSGPEPEPNEPVGFLPLTLDTPFTDVIPFRGFVYPLGFQVKTKGTYVIETFTPQGATQEAWVITLMDEQRTPIADGQPGSSDFGFNAKIEQKLDPGTYRVDLKHRIRSSLGKFGITVKKKK